MRAVYLEHPLPRGTAKVGDDLGVAARGDLGNSVLPDAANVGRRLAHAYATRGMALIANDP